MTRQARRRGAPERPWHTKTGWIILLLVVFAPVGIFLVYRAGIWRGAGRHIVSAVAALWFVIIAVTSASGGSDDKEADKPTTPAAVTTPAAPTSAAPIAATPTANPTTAKPASATTATKPPVPTATSAPSVSYKNCDAVKAAGAAPIRRGDPGYGKHLDKDGDGVACEN